jgi:hypothetical protein
MRESVIYRACDLSPDERRAAETLLGHALAEDEMVSVRTSKGRLLKQALTGDAREQTFQRLFDRIDRTAAKAEDVPAEEVEAAIDEAVDFVRHNGE